MKFATFFFLQILLAVQPALATVDANTQVFILVRHVQSEDYFIERAPVIGCYGLPKGPELAQLTRSYVVGNLGCGMDSSEDINALSCAKVVSSVEADDFSTFKEITLDLSACSEKTNPAFITGVKKVVQMNFATKTVKKPVLHLQM